MAGGLVGWLTDQTEVVASYAMGSVFAGHSSAVGGGLVGQIASGSDVTASYATGAVTGAGTKGGLVGSSAGTVTDSHWDTSTSGQTTSAGGSGVVGKTTSDLLSPTTYGATANDTYYNWNANIDGQAGNDDPWTFGAMDQYPALKYAGLGHHRAISASTRESDVGTDALVDLGKRRDEHCDRDAGTPVERGDDDHGASCGGCLHGAGGFDDHHRGRANRERVGYGGHHSGEQHPRRA